MEFIQFHPTALFHPRAAFLIPETVRGEGGILVNKYGEHLCQNTELADWCHGIGGPIHSQRDGTHRSDRVYLDLSALTADQIRHCFNTDTCPLWFDITAEPIPVSPAAHYMMGGILTDIRGRQVFQGCLPGETADTETTDNWLASNSPEGWFRPSYLPLPAEEFPRNRRVST